MSQLSKHQSDYIRDNLSKKSKNQIAKDLNVDKRLVAKYAKSLEREVHHRPDTAGSGAPSFLAGLASKIPENKRTFLAVSAIFILALALRLVYIKQLSHTYFFAPFQGGFDDYIFDNWAKEIVKGNWLGDRAIYIYRMPLYAYFLAFIYYLVGHSYWAVYVIQSLIGAGICVIVFWIGKLLANRTVGLIAGLLNAAYAYFLYYNGMLVGETLAIFFACLSFLLLLLFQQRAKAYTLFFAGIFIGISVLGRSNMLVLLPLILLWLAVFWRKEGLARVLRDGAVFIIGVILAIAPIMVRNYIVEKDVVPVVATAGINFYMGNAYGADGKYRSLEGTGGNAEQMLLNSIRIAEERSGRKLKPSEVSNYWSGLTIASIREHGANFLIPLYVRKFILFWNAYEIPDIWDYHFFKYYIPILRGPLVTFGFIVPLAFVGMYLGLSKKREFSLLYLFTIGCAASLLLVFINSRYRILAFPFLSLFASYAIVRAKDMFTENKATFAVCGAIFLGAILFSHMPVERVTHETSHNSLGILLKRDGRITEAINEYNKAIEMAPTFASPYYNLGLLYRDTENRDEAIKYLKKAVELDPANSTPARKKLEELLSQ